MENHSSHLRTIRNSDGAVVLDLALVMLVVFVVLRVDALRYVSRYFFVPLLSIVEDPSGVLQASARDEGMQIGHVCAGKRPTVNAMQGGNGRTHKRCHPLENERG